MRIYGVRLSLLSLLRKTSTVVGDIPSELMIRRLHRLNLSRKDAKALRTEDGGQVGNGLTLKVLRKHIKRLVNYAEAGDGEKIREELRRIVPEYNPKG